MSYGWSTRPTKVEVKHFLTGDAPAAVFDVGRYQITVQGVTQDAVPEITYVTDSRHRSGDPRQTFPNMDVSDGILRIPVEDIVQEMLSRLEPTDLARALWKNDDVRAEFMCCLVERYADGSVSDADRREFLVGVKEAIHDTAVAVLAEKFSDSEYALAKSVYYWNQVQRANDQLARAEQRVRQALGQPLEPDENQTEVFTIPRLRDDGQDPLTRIGGTAWHECRDWWRDKVAELFPGPEEVVEPQAETVI